MLILYLQEMKELFLWLQELAKRTAFLFADHRKEATSRYILPSPWQLILAKCNQTGTQIFESRLNPDKSI